MREPTASPRADAEPPVTPRASWADLPPGVEAVADDGASEIAGFSAPPPAPAPAPAPPRPARSAPAPEPSTRRGGRPRPPGPERAEPPGRAEAPGAATAGRYFVSTPIVAAFAAVSWAWRDTRSPPPGRQHRRHLRHRISTPAQFSYTIDGTGADGPRSEGGRRILLDNSRVYVRFLPFVSGRVHLGRINIYHSDYFR